MRSARPSKTPASKPKLVQSLIRGTFRGAGVGLAREKLLEFISRAPEKGNPSITKLRAEELTAFRTWIVAAAKEPAQAPGLRGLRLEQPRQRIRLLPELELEAGHATTSATASKLTRLPPCVAMYAGHWGRHTGTPISTTTEGESCAVSSRIHG